MTVKEIKEAALFQAQNDIEDVDDYRPVLAEYLDEAYDRMVFAFTGMHPGDKCCSFIKPLRDELEEPKIPERMHIKLADWVTWRILSLGSTNKQQRGLVYRQSFELALMEAKEQGMGCMPIKHFFHIPN